MKSHKKNASYTKDLLIIFFDNDVSPCVLVPNSKMHVCKMMREIDQSRHDMTEKKLMEEIITLIHPYSLVDESESPNVTHEIDLQQTG